jgi:hypothetical protein
MGTAPVFTPAELEAAVAGILGHELPSFGRKPDGSLYWGDVLQACARHCFLTRRAEDSASELVRRALLLVDEDLELTFPV